MDVFMQIITVFFKRDVNFWVLKLFFGTIAQEFFDAFSVKLIRVEQVQISGKNVVACSGNKIVRLIKINHQLVGFILIETGIFGRNTDYLVIVLLLFQ